MLLQPINPSRRVSCLFMTRSLQVVIRAFTLSFSRGLGLGLQALTWLCLSDSLHERIGVLPCSEPVCLSVSVLQALSGVIHLSGAVSAALFALHGALACFALASRLLQSGSSFLRYLILIAIWLILPVVICLSQRLSHACLSSHCLTVKPRMAH